MCFQSIKLISIGVLLDWIAVWKLAKKLNQLFDAIQSALTHRKWATDSQFILQRFINSTIEPAIITIQWLNIWEFEYFYRIFGVCVCVLSICPCWFVYFFAKSKTFEEIAITCVTFFDSLHQMFALRGRKFTMNLIVYAIGAFAIFSIGDCDLSVATEIIFTLFFFFVLWNERKHAKSFN